MIPTTPTGVFIYTALYAPDLRRHLPAGYAV